MAKQRKKDWKEQLLNLKKEMAKQEDPTIEDDEDSAAAIDKLRTRRIRLLKRSEPHGIIEAPIVICSYYLRRIGWKMLEKSGKCRKLHGDYLLLDTPLFGISEDHVAQMKLGVSDAVTQVFTQECSKVPGHTTCGHIRKKGDHYYVPLINSKLITGRIMSIYDWDFAPGVLSQLPDVLTAFDTAIAAMKPTAVNLEINIA